MSVRTIRSGLVLLAALATPSCSQEIEGEYEDDRSTGSLAAAANLYDEEFNDSSWRSGWTGSYMPTLVSDGYSGKAVRTRITGGSHYGANLSRFVNEDEAMYFRYYLKFASNWAPTSTGKLPGPADLNGTNRCKGGKKPTNAECWSARLMWRPNSGTTTDIGYYLYHADQAGTYGDGFQTGNDAYDVRFDAPGYTPLERNRWYCIEGYVEMNTPGQSNGILRGWVNGRPAQERTDIRFRNSASLGIERLWYDIYYGGKDASNRTQDVLIDRMALSTERIGCDSNAGDPMWVPGAEDEVFKDMAPGSFGYDAALKLKALGITHGCRQDENPMFCPRMSVSRSQMAAFFARALDLPSTNVDYFDDDEGSIFESAHNRLYESGITRGCGDRTYCGDEPVTRGQMAAFISRAFDLPAATQDYYSDDDGNIFENAINKMIEAGISNGCSASSFCAEREVTRAQMAIFLVRALGTP